MNTEIAPTIPPVTEQTEAPVIEPTNLEKTASNSKVDNASISLANCKDSNGAKVTIIEGVDGNTHQEHYYLYRPQSAGYVAIEDQEAKAMCMTPRP